MILIGQYDSPFVRRVGIALRLYDLPFTHQPWSSFSEADKIRPYNTCIRTVTGFGYQWDSDGFEEGAVVEPALKSAS